MTSGMAGINIDVPNALGFEHQPRSWTPHWKTHTTKQRMDGIAMLNIFFPNGQSSGRDWSEPAIPFTSGFTLESIAFSPGSLFSPEP